MTRKLLIKFTLITFVCVAGLTWGAQARAAALYCMVLAPAYNASNCEAGQNDKTNTVLELDTNGNKLTNLTSISSDNLKRDFIYNMNRLFSKGQYFQKTGASYIADRIASTGTQSWDQRVNDPEITLSVQTVSYVTNTAYNNANNTVIKLNNDPGTFESLVFTIDNQDVLYIKLLCGNPVSKGYDIPPIPLLPVITGTKVDTNGNPNSGKAEYSSDVISATVGIPSDPASDNSNPFTLNVKAGSVSVTAANASKNWKLVGYDKFTCSNGPTTCSNHPPGQYVGVTVAWGKSYTYALGTAKDGYTYNIIFYYQPIPPDKPVTITGDKVDTTGNPNGPYSTDPIRATDKAGTVSDARPQFNINTLQAGPISVTPDYVPGYTVVGYTVCNYTPSATVTGCTLPSFLTPTPGSTYVPIPQATAGQIYNMHWVFLKDKICSGPSCCTGSSCPVAPPCPNSGLADPKNISVSLPEPRTPTSKPTTPTTSSSPSSYLQYTPTGTKVTGIQDISNGGNPAIVPTLTSGPTQNPAVLDYSNYIKAYPYDNSQPRVVYDSNYTVTPWTLSFDHNAYSCSNPNPSLPGYTLISGPDASHKCTYSITTGGVQKDPVGIPKTTYCSNNTVGTWNGTDCGTYKSTTSSGPDTPSCSTGTPGYTGTPPTITSCSSVTISKGTATNQWTCNNPAGVNWSNYSTLKKSCSSGNRTPHWKCISPPAPSGSTISGTNDCAVTTYYKITYTPNYPTLNYTSPAASTTYTCPVNTPAYTSGGGTTNICSYDTTKTVMSYPFADVTVWYKYTAGTSYPFTESNNTGSTAPTMLACYNRGFSVTAVNAGSGVSLNNYENPTTATAGGYSATVTFSYTNVAPTQGLRQPMKVVNLAYSYKFSTGCAGSGTFGVTGGLSASGPSPYPVPAAAVCGVSAPPLQPGDIVCVSYRASPTGSTMDINGNIVINNGGTISTSPSTPQCSGPVVNEPYFKVFGGDISSGGTFATTSATGATTCKPNPNNSGSGVYGWNTATIAGYPQYAGAGAQFGVTALGVITGVASNQNNLNATPWALPTPGSSRSDPTGLSFSNTTASAATGNFGGGFGAASCPPDYYSSKPAVTTTLPYTASLAGLSGTYSLAGGSTITDSTIGVGQHIIVYAAGNVFINGNITFGGPYTTVDQIPSLVLIVQGNILIGSGVKTLSGVYIAQPVDPMASPVSDGIIYDCAYSVNQAVPSNALYASCGTQLTVNGSLIANKVVLMRTGDLTNNKLTSSLRASTTTETPSSTHASEIFNYGPAFWMGIGLPQSSSTGTATNSAGYDSIISLPPIL